MSPEQIDGRDVDTRSDLFSFGAVLHETLSGQRAFDGDCATSIHAAILGHEPPPVSSLQPLAPTAIDEIVRRCLAKDPDGRWRTAGDVLRELTSLAETLNASHAGAGERRKWMAAVLVTATLGLAAWLWTASPPPGATVPAGTIRSIAVLPLADLSGGPDQEYFAEGMTEQLIGDLATIQGLRVISRTSVTQYRGTAKPAPTVARELRVDGIIEGAIVRATDSVRITARLIAGASGEVLWSQTFERDWRDVLTLQRDVARAITRRVDITLTPPQQARLGTAPPVDPEGHRQVLLGRHLTAKATEADLRQAIQHFDRAIARDATNAMAHAGLAEAHVGLTGHYVAPRQAMPLARRAAETAIALDASLADAHGVLGYIHLVYDWNGPAAEAALLRALDLNPTLAAARLHYAAYLTTQARHDEAVGEITRAVEIDPASIRTNAIATSLLLFARRYDDAIELARKGLEFEPRSGFALAFQGVAYAEKGRYADAVANLEKAAQLDHSPTIKSLQAHVLAVAGKRADARRVIREVEDSTKHGYFCPYEIGTAYVSLGDVDTAYRWFRKGVEERADCMAWLGVEPWIEPFRRDARYADLLQEIGLDPDSNRTR
jgi:TolB-like protein/tetratricopeptide (TPR) repeat protein